MKKAAIAILTLASFGATFAVAQTPADNTTKPAKTKKEKKHHSKKKGADQTTAPAPAPAK